MTGIITLTSTGLILAETFESYPNGWTFDYSGSTTATAGLTSKYAHSGSGGFKIETGYSWPSSAYARLYKSVNVGTGANRVLRTFRGPAIKAACIDDFPGSSLDTALWTVEAGNNPVSGSRLTVNGQLDSSGGKITVRDPLRIAAKLAWASGAKDLSFRPFNYSDNDKVDFAYNPFSDGHLNVRIYGPNGNEVDDEGTQDANDHIWEAEWLATGVKIWKDGTLIITSTKYPYDEDGYYIFFGVMNSGSFSVDWIGVTSPNTHRASIKVGSQTIWDVDEPSETLGTDNNFFDTGWTSLTPTGTQTIELKIYNNAGVACPCDTQHIFDDLIIMLDKTITIQGLLGGQKIELYDSGGSLRESGTCPQTGQNVTLTGMDGLILTSYGFSGYFKVYDTNGTTLLYTSSTTTMWGGDVWTWIPNQSNCAITTTATQIYRSGSGLTPTACTVTVTLTDAGTGNPLSGKTINWTPNLGTVSPSSGTTDSYGHASTTFTAGSSPGLGGVRADFPGDATYGPSSALQLLDVYYAAPTPDSTKDFQVWVAGQEVVDSTGNYTLSSDFKPQPFSFTTPVMNLVIGGWWAVDIYRKGVLEYSGRIMTRRRQTGTNPTITITGVDNTIMLQRRVTNKAYTDEPKNIILDLLSRYPCGITAGSISLYGNTITIDATYDNLFDALTKIAAATGWIFRRNANNTLDFAPSFGTIRSITVQIGVNATQNDHQEDWTNVDSKVFLIGTPSTLVSIAENTTAELTYGLIEEVFLEKSITAQGTLDLQAAQQLLQNALARETISLDWIDELASGSYGPFDTLQVVDQDAGLNGSFQVNSVQRDLTDANLAMLQLTNSLLTVADALQLIRKDVKDMGVS